MAEEKPKLATRHLNVLEDPGAAHVARTYAISLLDAAGREADAVLQEYGSFISDVLPKVPGPREAAVVAEPGDGRHHRAVR